MKEVAQLHQNRLPTLSRKGPLNSSISFQNIFELKKKSHLEFVNTKMFVFPTKSKIGLLRKWNIWLLTI